MATTILNESAATNATIECKTLLDRAGTWRSLKARHNGHDWDEFHISEAADSPVLGGKTDSFLVCNLPVEIHFHGLGDIDFSDLENLDLDRIQRALAAEGIYGVPTIFLHRKDLPLFCDIMAEFDRKRAAGDLPNFLGIAIEGPLLNNAAGTPNSSRWEPTWREWKLIAAQGARGLVYVVFSPNALPPQAMERVAAELLENQVRVSVGHFGQEKPQEAAASIEVLLRLAEQRHEGPYGILTDHLFNDMPRNFRHAHRGSKAKLQRDQRVRDLRLEEWNFSNLELRAGAVPAALIRAARDRRLTLAINFDCEHVDAEIVQRVVQIVGATSILAMTDRIEIPSLAGQSLIMPADETLWYQDQDEGVVAAGSSTIDDQIRLIRGLGIDEADVWEMTSLGPARLLRELEWASAGPPRACCLITPDKKRLAVYAGAPMPSR